MFGQHVTGELSAYAHGELTAEATARVASHLDACGACRREFDEIKLGIRLVEHLPTRTAPSALWDEIETGILKESARRAKADAAPTRRAPLAVLANVGASLTATRRRLAVAACALVVACVGVWLYWGATRPAWEVARLEGAPTVGPKRIGTKGGKLAVGEWLETDEASRAQIQVANLGQVDVDPHTRVRLMETRWNEHRLELARGRMHARIWAPPRVFFVNTPSAVAADLGCAYTLEVDDRGRSLLHVTSGWVALETPGRESVVPAGAACATEPGKGPGTPFFEDAPEPFLAALARFDFEDGGAEALANVVGQARPRDTLTLWHLLSRADGDERARVYDRLASFAPPPAGVTREGVLRLERPMLDRWKENLEPTWQQESFPAFRKAWRSLWR
ncbi:MAG TPA: FecR domain-containing protein [Pyrinomonadaceae bacterium]|nr:FecR domain-containing protein [Pyrinomonadaceae bacterium]